MKNLKDYKKLSESYFAGSEKPIIVRSYFKSGDTIQVIVNEGVPFPTMDELRHFVEMLRPRRLQYMCVVYTLKGKNFVSEIDLVELLGGIKNEDEKKIKKDVVQSKSRRNPPLKCDSCVHWANDSCGVYNAYHGDKKAIDCLRYEKVEPKPKFLDAVFND